MIFKKIQAFFLKARCVVIVTNKQMLVKLCFELRDVFETFRALPIAKKKRSKSRLTKIVLISLLAELVSVTMAALTLVLR